jgi:hypothetical protein
MPQLGQYKPIMDTVFFLYPTEEDARAGTKYGGTGFLVGVPSKRWPDEYYHIHGVSNWHVIAGKTGASAETAAFRKHFLSIRANGHLRGLGGTT